MKYIKSLKIRLSLFIFFLMCFSNAYAWGGLGHKAIAYIAESHLTPNARKKIEELIGLESKNSLAEIAMWADLNRDLFFDMPRHVVSIPIEKNFYVEERDCTDLINQCIVMGIERQISILNNEDLSSIIRLNALKLVVHLIGDIHQPLHVTNKTSVKVIFREKNYSMHGIWDKQAVMYFGLKDPEKLSIELLNDIPVFNHGEIYEWANEGHEIAARYFKPIFDETAKGQPFLLQDEYLQSISPVIKLRLQQAGVRLGRVLNEIFDSPK